MFSEKRCLNCNSVSLNNGEALLLRARTKITSHSLHPACINFNYTGVGTPPI